jgi:glycosyltransferase involved in cell wall biosynthesis
VIFSDIGGNDTGKRLHSQGAQGATKLRVLTCAFACSPSGNPKLGSGEAVLGWNLVTQLARFHEVHVLTHPSNREGIEKGLQVQARPTLSFDYFDLPRWLGVLRKLQGCFQVYAYLWQIKAYFVARRLHRQIRFDVFHHVTYANDWMASFVGALLPIPYVRGPGGGANRTPAAFLREYTFRDRLWERLRSLAQWVLRHDPVFIFGQRRARAILVCTHESLRAIRRRWRYKAQLFPVNGVTSSDVSASDPPDTRCSGFEVLAAGKLLHWKGFGLAIRAFAAFAGRHSDTRYTIIGDGPEYPRLRALVERLAVEPVVCFSKWLPRDQVISKMRSCDVFLYGSLRDGGGAVVVEAMAAGKPIICLDLAGPGMHVTEECGIKIPPRSPDETIELMTRALERLYQDRELCMKMGHAARARAEQVYRWDHLGDRLLKIYKEVLGAPSHEA